MVEPPLGHEAGASARPTRARRAGPHPAPAALPLPTLGETGARDLDLVGPRLSARARADAAGCLPPDRAHGRPSCMARWRFAFGTTRLPGPTTSLIGYARKRIGPPF